MQLMATTAVEVSKSIAPLVQSGALAPDKIANHAINLFEDQAQEARPFVQHEFMLVQTILKSAERAQDGAAAPAEAQVAAAAGAGTAGRKVGGRR